MDWVWFLFEFDGRINRAKVRLATLIILCWMIFVAAVMLGIDGIFGNPTRSVRFGLDFALMSGIDWRLSGHNESVHFSVNDVFALFDPAVLRAAIARVREGKEASPAHLVLAFFHCVGTLLFVWVYLATSIQRLHDRQVQVMLPLGQRPNPQPGSVESRVRHGTLIQELFLRPAPHRRRKNFRSPPDFGSLVTHAIRSLPSLQLLSREYRGEGLSEQPLISTRW